MIVLVGVTSGLVGGTAATLNATTTNPGFIATPSLPGPSGPLTATISNGDISLTWTAGGLGNGNEYQAYRASSIAATPAACPTNSGGTGDQSYTPGTAVGFTNLAALTDTGTETLISSTAGFVCYMLFGAYTAGAVPSAPVWISHPVAAPFNPIANAHLPLIATAIAYKNSGAACGATCTLDAGDAIQITFNQPTTAPAIAGTTDVCVDHVTGAIFIGSAIVGNTCTPASGQVGAISPPAGCTAVCFSVPAAKDPDYKATYAWNPAGGCPVIGVAATASTVLCVTLATNVRNTPLTVKNTGWIFTPSTTANIQSNDATVGNRVGVCVASTACQPVTATQP